MQRFVGRRANAASTRCEGACGCDSSDVRGASRTSVETVPSTCIHVDGAEKREMASTNVVGPFLRAFFGLVRRMPAHEPRSMCARTRCTEEFARPSFIASVPSNSRRRGRVSTSNCDVAARRPRLHRTCVGTAHVTTSLELRRALAPRRLSSAVPRPSAEAMACCHCHTHAASSSNNEQQRAAAPRRCDRRGSELQDLAGTKRRRTEEFGTRQGTVGNERRPTVLRGHVPKRSTGTEGGEEDGVHVPARRRG